MKKKVAPRLRPSPKPCSSPIVDEDYKIRISKLVQAFRESEEQDQMLANLNNHERRYVHELSKKFGLKTKSKGEEPNRVLTLSKPSLSIQHPVRLNLSTRARHELALYFEANPASESELAFVHSSSAPAPNLLLLPTSSHRPHHGNKKQPPCQLASPPPPPLVSAARQALPIFSHRAEILACLASADVTIISGETGSGKSTQAVQYVLDEDPRNRIVCTQPRRLPCTSLAARVASERNSVLGQEVGYSVRFDTKFQENSTRLLFCTTGVALMKLRGGGEEGIFAGMTHLFLDEIHDRDANSDFLLVFCKEILAKRIKVVLMSATLSIEAFQTYFAGMKCESVKVKGNSFPVRSLFLDDVLRLRHGLPP